MSAAGEARASAAKGALVKAAQALEWLADAQQAAVEPNGEAAYARRCAHARQRLLEAVALLDGRPAAVAQAAPALDRTPAFDVRGMAYQVARAGAGR